jgi:hypothetical protein
MRVLNLAAIVLLLAAGCVSTSTSPGRTTVRCGTVVAISRADQARAARELAALPPGSVIATKLLPDHLRMRDEARACRRT